MKKVSIYILLILPVFLFVTGYILKEAGGPYYLNYYDPGYVYLINSLNLMQFSNVGHFDHPGTTVQVIGAIILKIYFISSNSYNEIIKEVFSRPEFYLNLINKTLILINSALLFLLGVFIFKITENLYLSLLIQLSPFISFEIFYGLVIVAPENLLISSSLCFIGLLLYYIYKKDLKDSAYPLVIAFAIICGFGLATKLNFLPLCIIPLIIIKKLKYKILFIVTTFLSFLIFFSPAISNYERFVNWTKNLIIHTGIHGRSDITPFDVSVFFNNVLSIFSKDKFFTVVYFFILITLTLSYLFHSNKSNKIILRKEKLVLLSILVATTFQVCMVAKNYLPYAQYYMIPSFMLLVMGISIALSLLFEILKKYFTGIRLKYIYLTASLLILSYGIIEIVRTYEEATLFRDEAYKVRNLIRENYKNEFVIPTMAAANDESALVLATMHEYGGDNNSKYKALLNEMLRSKIYYNQWENNFFTISEGLDIKKTIQEKKKIIMQLNTKWIPLDIVISLIKKNYNFENITYKKIFMNMNGESIYEIELK